MKFTVTINNLMYKMIMYSKGRNDETYDDVKSDVFVADAGSCGMGTWASECWQLSNLEDFFHNLPMGLGRLTPVIIWLVVQ